MVCRLVTLWNHEVGVSLYLVPIMLSGIIHNIPTYLVEWVSLRLWNQVGHMFTKRKNPANPGQKSRESVPLTVKLLGCTHAWSVPITTPGSWTPPETDSASRGSFLKGINSSIIYLHRKICMDNQIKGQGHEIIEWPESDMVLMDLN